MISTGDSIANPRHRRDGDVSADVGGFRRSARDRRGHAGARRLRRRRARTSEPDRDVPDPRRHGGVPPRSRTAVRSDRRDRRRGARYRPRVLERRAKAERGSCARYDPRWGSSACWRRCSRSPGTARPTAAALPHPLRLAAIADHHHRDDLQLPVVPILVQRLGGEGRRNRGMGTGRVRPDLRRLTAVPVPAPCQHRRDAAHHLPREDSLMTNQECAKHDHPAWPARRRHGRPGRNHRRRARAPVAADLLAPATQEATFQPVSLGPIVRSRRRPASRRPLPRTSMTPPSRSRAALPTSTTPAARPRLARPPRDVRRLLEPLHPRRMSRRGLRDRLRLPLPREPVRPRGDRIAGPALRPLDRFQWEIRKDDELWITQRWSVLLNGDKRALLTRSRHRASRSRASSPPPTRSTRPSPTRHGPVPSSR